MYRPEMVLYLTYRHFVESCQDSLVWWYRGGCCRVQIDVNYDNVLERGELHETGGGLLFKGSAVRYRVYCLRGS